MRNLPRIIRAGGLKCYNHMCVGGDTYENIAHENIQDKRARKDVPKGLGGKLHDYVPFYFGPRSPMLNAISHGRVEGHEEGQEPVVHLVTTFDRIQAAGLPFVFTDGHAVMDFATFYDDPADFVNVDWPLMQATYWNDINSDPNRSFRRQAEFLIHGFFPWELFVGIGVMNNTIKEQTEQAILEAAHKPTVVVRHNFYY